MENKSYQGKNERGVYEQFDWSKPNPPTEEETGLTDIEEINNESTIDIQ